ncbi:hypothetical protein MWU65_11960 [Cellulophaga sp. F20128]|uniref:hypothetical protein n=1 Tax=Cellulophaga sp. F20128 TaxID=2926413 RepID=UPI001FF6D086|nr:hypothetical protein [Cellulophaga sp. F20128]MCK0157901.1 hypothetical protein [Cellulophaga sp. F20128]
MVLNDLTVSTILIVVLICHLATLIVGYKKQRTSVFISYLNAVMGVGLIVFWAIDGLTVKPHTLEVSELVVLGLEVCIILFALYTIFSRHTKTYIKAINYIGFGMHVLATSGMLYFLTTFKLDKLF